LLLLCRVPRGISRDALQRTLTASGTAMAKLVIKDLSASVELDREAMTAIVGGARGGARFAVTAQTQPAAAQTVARVVDYPPGFPSAQPVADSRFPRQSLLRK
jgi:hypothetical protein